MANDDIERATRVEDRSESVRPRCDVL